MNNSTASRFNRKYFRTFALLTPKGVLLSYFTAYDQKNENFVNSEMKKPIVAPSLLACDFANIQSEVEMLNESEADWLHLDVMDGRFVPNISFGLPVIEAIARHTNKHLDCHLMIVEPDKYLEGFRDAGANSISVHIEACDHLHRSIHFIKDLGCMAGVAVNPHTSVELLRDILPDLDYVCLMSVNPGFGGQRFIENTYTKVQKLRAMANEMNPSMMIQIDGGVIADNAPKLVASGADNLVAGSFVFKSANPKETISGLKKVGGVTV